MMSTATSPQVKITYTSGGAALEEFHKSFDAALVEVQKRFGQTYPLYLNGKPLNSPLSPIVDISPVDTSIVLGKFSVTSPEQVDEAVRVARAAQKEWARMPWAQRLVILRRAANEVRRRKYELAAIMGWEVGKSRLEAMGEVEETADLIDYYCLQMEEAQGFVRPLGQTSPNENTKSVLRPYGVFACIAPFNFPLALSVGMSSAALIAGNAVIFKPTQETSWTGLMIYEVYSKAGVPGGVFQFLSGTGSVTGNALWKHPGVDGVVFTGSKEVGMSIYKQFSAHYPKPVLMEMGGKNPTVVTASADLEKAAEGVMRSAFGLQGQKCSACSRVYVDKKVESSFKDLLLAKTKAIKIGNPTERDVFFGPVISDKSVKTYEEAARQSRDGGEILYGGYRLKEGAFSKGYFVAPTIAKLPKEHPLNFQELFVPFVSIVTVTGLSEAIEQCNKAEYGLTAGIFSKNQEEIERFFDEVESGVCYANRSGGATTGAWPGVQSFCGWKGSGSTGKGGLGPYYLAQFMREQSRTIIE